MKLIRCYIENFGGLQQYSVSFNEDLTIIHEPNGFGKTTLAEFIRAMFYGFPRANKDVTKNPRLKYLPWQGGRYGGYLIFEHEGKRYRIDRSFGEAPKGDKFKLTDEDTHREVRDFTADIGTELFGIDGDAFLRSTYMPQNRDNAPLTNDSLRAKLGNLLEDTGDVGSYEKALQRLKDKRTTYEHFRGNGGSIHELSRSITALQSDIAVCRSKEALLEEAASAIEDAEQAHALGEEALTDIRARLTKATTAQAEAALSREYEGLVAAEQNSAAALQQLQARYPKGLPTQEALEAAAQRMDKAASLQAAMQQTAAGTAAEETIQALEAVFAKGVPTEEDFAAHRTALDRRTALTSELRSAALTDEEQKRLADLSLQFRDSVPTDQWLNDCREKRSELTRLEAERRTLTLSKDDSMRLQTLDSFFAAGVPTQEQLEHHSRQLEQAEQLRQENLRIAATLPAAEPAPTQEPKKFHSMFLPCLILGLAAAAAGVWALTMGQDILPYHSLIGGILAGAAAALLLTAILKQNNHKLMMTLLQQQIAAAAVTAAQRKLMEDNALRAEAMEADVAAFLQSYPADAQRSLSRRLRDMETNRALYLPLRQRARDTAAAAKNADDAIAHLTETLSNRLSLYFATAPDFDSALSSLQNRKQQYLSLKEKQDTLSKRAAALETELTQVNASVGAFLLSYCSDAAAADFPAALDKLRTDAQRYAAAVTHLQRRDGDMQQRKTALAQLEAAQNVFAQAYDLPITLTDRQLLKTAERDAESCIALEARSVAARKALEDFLAQHGPKPASALPTDIPDPAALQLAEQEQIKQQNALHSRLLQLQQKRQLLNNEIDRIPALSDELQRKTEQKAADTESRRLLDETIALLQKARESLSNNYLGGVQGYFAKYLNRLTGESTAHIAVNSDLEVQLERAGSPRSLPHFSAGQTDAVHLCMRLALADALFDEGGCFMILDDPFVNLDEAHTAQALALIRDLAKERQIIYMVCNESRI